MKFAPQFYICLRVEKSALLLCSKLKMKDEGGFNVGAETQVPVMGKNSDEKQVVL